MESIADRYRHAAAFGRQRSADHHDKPERAARYRLQGRGERLPGSMSGEAQMLHKIEQLRESEVLKPTEAIRMPTDLLEQSTSDAREPDAESEPPS
ncbi:hypothetical protein [Bradyrhizobium japonicum]|jgi:sirohydrochlorin ferrochelatase|uniref:Sirohydrochlorin ferrochelatase n=1 Tax=Bradyrhizobium japonicum TaxID=375 RepID=A0ABV2RTF0_BRAJP|nr:hypothetical protein [Bradyrhizobium japonicum]MBR0914274.1 hypothetical protein [Bradyrhizobium japonicum]MCP1764020.1 sirohydrochlorin ferrochelatase [Bradyrhizobium japonicum]MCP1786157.1 sirohydrochlorin ferrochelatase [Bradyrhizobium japonicum]MCP1808036.1 sirohydrochlorin ferrochelatase [Bradyrhizobium japonicum]MCP1816963.1 sirohydrochlorin ferrochelatase [Bradyrhizobium japonicum]